MTVDAGLHPPAFGLAAEEFLETLGRIEQFEQGAAFALGFAFLSRPWPLSLLEVLGFAGAGRLGLYSTTMSRAAATISRRTADSAVRKMPSTSR